MLPNTLNDNLFFNLVKDGSLVINEDLSVVSSATGKRVDRMLNDGYFRVILKVNDTYKGIQLHRLVWMVFHNSLIPDGYVVNHINCIPSDNSIENLEVVTYAENNLHSLALSGRSLSWKQNQKIAKQGESNGMAKFFDFEVVDLRQMFANRLISIPEIQAQFYVCRRTVENLLRGISYSHLATEFTVSSVKGNQFKDEDISYILSKISSGIPKSELAKEFGLNRSTFNSRIKPFLNR